MRYQSPEMLYALLAIAIPILIHLLNFRKHKNIHFSSIRFLKEMKKETQKRSRLKNFLILLTRILAITFLIITFARPYIPSNLEEEVKNIFIYLDNSFSMDAENEDGRLLDVAKEKARAITKVYPNESNFYLITNDLLPIHSHGYTKETIVEQIDKIQSSCRVRSIQEVLNYQQTIGNKNSHLYIISDMQKSTIKIEEINTLPDEIDVFISTVTAKKKDNLTIDSCWINEPVLTSNKNIELFVTIMNNSEVDINNEVVFLNINNVHKSQQFVTIKANEREQIKFNFSTAQETKIKGEIIINDSPITFDNKLYFTLEKTKKINIFCINKSTNNKSLNILFNDTALFNYQNFIASNVDYGSMKKQDLIILNQITELSSGLLNTLNKILLNGGSILLIPDTNINIDTYNLLLKQLQINTIKNIENKQIEISTINTEHKIFQKVFEGDLKRINYPFANSYFTTNNYHQSYPLLSFDNNKPFLSAYLKEKGWIYQLNSPLNINHTNFTKHALFVPTLLNIAVQSVGINNLYHIISHKNLFSINHKNINNDLIHLKNDIIDIIPTTQIISGKSYYYTQNQITKNGIYSITSNTKIVDEVAFNYDIKESKIDPMNTKEIQKWIDKKELINMKLIASELIKFKEAIKEQQTGQAFWKISLILSILFFGLEILLIKLIKS